MYALPYYMLLKEPNPSFLLDNFIIIGQISAPKTDSSSTCMVWPEVDFRFRVRLPTAVRFSVDGAGSIGIIANESEPFCQTCSRLRLSSNGKLYGCLSSAANYDLTELLSMSNDFAVAKLQSLLGLALADKQTVSFRGEVTVMKFIGG